MTPFDTYSRLNMVVLSGTMTSNNGKKSFSWPPGWQKKLEPDYHEADSGFIMRTGKDVGICAIDIDDPTLSHNIELMDLMISCNFVQQTKKGFHYIFKYDERIKQTTSESLKLDTRSDGGCIFCEPSICKSGEEIIGRWEWIKTPFEDEEISEIPEEVIQYLQNLNQGYVSMAAQQEHQQEEACLLVRQQQDPSDADPDVLLAKVITGLSSKRWDNYDSWLKIGMIFYNEGLSLQMWDELSKKSKSYTPGACGKKWLSFNESRAKRLSEATLWFWLKEDNPSLFYTLMEQRDTLWQLIELLNHNNVADYYYNCFPDQYLYNDKLKWFTLKSNNTWDKSNGQQPSGMKRSISDTMQALVMDMKKTEVQQYAAKSSNTTERDEQDKLLKNHKAKLNIIHKAYKTLGSSEFCNGVISFLPSYYEKKDLEDIMDMNRDLFAFTDGVFDCTICKFRSILPDDYISVTTGYTYPKQSNPEVRQKIKEVLHGMFECEETEKHLLSVLASCLYGRNKWEEFYVWTGSGRNGKGMLATLLSRIFGNYYIAVDMKLFTKQAKSRSEPNPTLLEARTARIMIASEAESKEKLQTAFIRNISGNDAIKVRTLHSADEFTYIPQFKVILQCNTIPELTELETAVMARMKVTHFPFSFQKPEDMHLGDSSKNKVQDPNLKEFCEKSIEWRDEMALLLTEVYAEIKNLNALPLPTKVKDASREYFDSNNPLKQWLEKYFEITKDEKDRIGAAEMKERYGQKHPGSDINDMKFKSLMNVNNVYSKRFMTGVQYFGIKTKNLLIE